MDRYALTQAIEDAMDDKGLTYKQVADGIGMSTVFVTAALLGQMALPEEAAAKAADILGIPEAKKGLAKIPSRGALGMDVPTDPLIYRFYEIVQVYGTTFKKLIEEEFGDGIMSAIDYDMEITRKPDPNGDRVQVVMSGKFLKFKKY
jgi:cyanate lyase